jgi:putrescine transport system substrate-binding protein
MRSNVLLAAVAAISCLATFASPGALSQGMRSVSSAASGESAGRVEFDAGELEGISERQIATLQRLLRRLGHLKDDDMSRAIDAKTKAAISRFISFAKPAEKPAGYEELLRLMFTAIWEREGWGKGQAEGQDTIVDKERVKNSQEALKKLGYEPGPIDGKFGPATLASVEVFQQDLGMKIDGLLTRNTHDAVLRALSLNGQSTKGEVRVLNWPDYIDPAVLERFSKETQIRVVHDVFENSDETKELLLSGSSSYDVIVQGSSQLRSILEQKAIQEIDFNKLPNYDNLDPEALRYTARLDPDNKHSLPYMWGTVGIGVNEEAVKNIFPNAKVNSLSMFLDPAAAKALSACGLAFVDEPSDVVPAIVAYLGGDIGKIGIADLEAVDQVLAKVAPYVKTVSVGRYIDDLAEGKYCAIVGYSGDMYMARDAAQESGKGKISYYVPVEGSQLWFDLMVIPAKAKNADEAYKFLNFLLEPEVAAANTNYLRFANPNKASAPFIEEALMNDSGLYPPAEVLARLEVLLPMTPNVEAELTRIWAKLTKADP